MSINLTDVVSAWVNTCGYEKAAEILQEKLGKNYSEASFRNWEGQNVAPPLKVCQVALDEMQIGEAGQIEEEEGFKGAKIFIGSPIYRDISPWMYKATHVLRHKYGTDLGLLMEVGTDIGLNRNRIADRFLATDGEWLLWLDDDMAPPIGYPSESRKWGARFNDEFNRTDVLARLMKQEKTIVSALYFDRSGTGVPMFAEGRNDADLAERIRTKGPKNELLPTKWVGGGCVLVHRQVYVDMLDKIPSIRKPNSAQPNGFYNKLDWHGEDVSFCIRAKEAGHQSYVDLGCICGHAGTVVHFNEKIR